jgi:protein translocase SecG subunit
MTIASLVKIGQLVIAALLIILVIIQERGGGISESIIGSEGGGFYQHRRGLEKVIFIATIICLVLFIAASIASLLIK